MTVVELHCRLPDFIFDTHPATRRTDAEEPSPRRHVTAIVESIRHGGARRGAPTRRLAGVGWVERGATFRLGVPANTSPAEITFVLQAERPEPTCWSSTAHLPIVASTGAHAVVPLALPLAERSWRRGPVPRVPWRFLRPPTDPESMALHLRRVEPYVSRATGWSGLANDVTVEVTSRLDRPLEHILLNAGLEVRAAARLALRLAMGVMFGALYDPWRRTIFVNRGWLHVQNVDQLAVLLGHELVHVGQFDHTPGLMDEYREELVERLASASQPRGAAELRRLMSWPFMANIEGYAAAIETHELRPRFPLAAHLRLARRPQELVDRLTRRLLPELVAGARSKQAQYDGGRRGYEARARDRGWEFVPSVSEAADQRVLHGTRR